MSKKRSGIYARCLKRIIDFLSALILLIILSPVFLILTLTGLVAMKGNPFFVQPRPGKKDPSTGKEKIFMLIKFRSMSNAKDKNGKLLPDSDRLNAYGRFLRKTSLDELPQLFNVFCGQYSLVGPRPMLVRDMVFMSDEVRQRHTVYPGISGLAQINGRNSISWEEKFRFDLKYVSDGITFIKDLKILMHTVLQVFKSSENVREGTATDIDYGDWLLETGKVTQEEYDKKQEEAMAILREYLG